MEFYYDKWESKSKRIKSNSTFKEVIESLDKQLIFLSQLSDLIWLNGNVNFISYGGRYFMMRTELIESTESTLKSISILLDSGNFSDINVLIRKFRDDLFLYLYFLEVSNRFDDTKKSIHDENCFDWMEGKLKKLQFTDILIYLMKNKDLEKVISKYNLRKAWKDIGVNLNNFVHANGISYVRKNYISQDSESVERMLKDIEYKIEYISSIFVVLVILIKPFLISSNDYINYLDMGIPPEVGSQYWVAPFIQTYLDENIVNLNPGIKTFIRENVYMEIK